MKMLFFPFFHSIMKDLKKVSLSSLRRFLLITFSHAESRGVSKEDIVQRLLKAFVCKSVIVAQEKHLDEGNMTHPPLGTHFHVSVLNESASKNNATSIIRKLFPEFEGSQCHVSFHRAFASLCSYVTKQDSSPLVWGNFTLAEILDIAKHNRIKDKEKASKVSTSEIIKQLKECSEWDAVYGNPYLSSLLLSKYGNMKSIHAELQIVKMRESSAIERLQGYLESRGFPNEYSAEMLKEKYVLLDWIACQLAFHRPIKTKQLFIYGKPNAQKTLIFNMLSKALRIYFPSSRFQDFSGADDFYDLWIFDEFDLSGAPAQQVNTLLKILDGQECRVDCKYREVFHKTRNVPIVFLGNTLPSKVKQPGPMQERFLRLRFESNLPQLQEERVVATLWGCLLRRIDQKKAALAIHNDISISSISIRYNEITAPARKHVKFPAVLCLSLSVSEDGDGEKDFVIATRDTWTREDSTLHSANWVDFMTMFVNMQRLQDSPFLSLLEFGIIPLKYTPENLVGSSLYVFAQKQDGAYFRIDRQKDKPHCLMWPLYASFVEAPHSTSTSSKNAAEKLPLSIKLELEDPLLLHLEKKYLNLDGNEKKDILDLSSYEFLPSCYCPSWKIKLGVPGDAKGCWDEKD